MSDLSRALVIVGILTPVCATGLGVGDIRQHSTLNQRLSAEIPLALSGDDAVDKLKIRLATPEAFSNAGIDRSHVLSQLRFTPVTKPNGQHFIQVTSVDSIHEPFLDFLLEVHSDQGSVIREFTILLDPIDQETGLSSAPGSGNSFSQSTDNRYIDGFEDRVYTGDNKHSERSQQRVLEQSTIQQEPSPIIVSNDLLTGEVYGPVRRREKLMDIAQRIIRPAAVSVEEMAWGIYRANPHAFRRSIHGLKAGSLLRLPNEAFLAQYNSDYPNHTHKAPGSLKENQKPLTTDRAQSQIASQTASDASGQANLTLKRENEELRHRLTLVEQRLEEAQRLVTQKTDEILLLKNQVHATSTQASSPPSSATLVDEIKDSSQSSAGTPLPPDKLSQQPLPQPSRLMSYPTTTTAPASAQEKASWASRISPSYWLASGALILLGVGAFVMRRRHVFTFVRNDKVQTDYEQQRGLTGSVAANPATNQLPNVLIEEVNILDPLAEADVYIRYGRFAQAEKLMMEAIRKEPERHTLKLKLLEIYNLSGQVEASNDYQEYLDTQTADVPLALRDKARSMRPNPKIDTRGDISGSHASESVSTPLALADQHTALETGHDADQASYDASDFAAELLALEAEYSTSTPKASEPTTEAERKTETQAKRSDISNGLMDLSDTDFTEELRSLEAQYTDEPSAAGSFEAANEISPQPKDNKPVENAPTTSMGEISNAIDYVPPSLEQWPQPEHSTDGTTSFKIQENLVSYENFTLVPDRKTLTGSEFRAKAELSSEIFKSLEEPFVPGDSRSPSVSASQANEELDLEDTDFTIELRSLQASYAGEKEADSFRKPEMELAIAYDTEELSAAKGLPETQGDPQGMDWDQLQINSSSKAHTNDAIEQPLAEDQGIYSRPKFSAAGTQPHDTVPVGTLNPDQGPSLAAFDMVENSLDYTTRFDAAPQSPPSPKRFGLLSFDIELIDPRKTVKTETNTWATASVRPQGSSTPEMLLAQARIHLKNGENPEARKLLQELLDIKGNQHQKVEAGNLLSQLNKVKLSLVTSNGPKLFGNPR